MLQHLRIVMIQTLPFQLMVHEKLVPRVLVRKSKIWAMIQEMETIRSSLAVKPMKSTVI